MPSPITISTTIASGQTVGAVIDLSSLGSALVGFQMPAAFTGASITFQASLDGITYGAVYNESNTALSVTVAVNRVYTIPAYWFDGFKYLKFVSASAEGADRTIQLALIAHD